MQLKKLQIVKGEHKGTENTSVGHTSQVLTIAITTDSKFLVSVLLKFMCSELSRYALKDSQFWMCM